MVFIETFEHLALASSNLQETKKFYADLLGFEILEETDEALKLQLGTLNLLFSLVSDYTGNKELKNRIVFVLDTDEFTEALQELEEKNIELLEGPITTPGGEAIYLEDPDSHILELTYQA